jgi:hypothetical protein
MELGKGIRKIVGIVPGLTGFCFSVNLNSINNQILKMFVIVFAKKSKNTAKQH